MKNKDNIKNKTIIKIKNYFSMHKTQAEIIRFLIVGGFATIIDMLAMGLVLYLFQPAGYNSFLSLFIGDYKPKTISTIIGTGTGFLCGLIFNYVFSIIFVYEDKGISKSRKGFYIFFMLSFIGLLIHLGGMYLGYTVLNINEWIVKIFLTLVVLVYNYVSKKSILFTKTKTENSVTEQPKAA
jgi:putative flippase GtrA